MHGKAHAANDRRRSTRQSWRTIPLNHGKVFVSYNLRELSQTGTVHRQKDRKNKRDSSPHASARSAGGVSGRVSCHAQGKGITQLHQGLDWAVDNPYLHALDHTF
jgi:hypothetical protein